MNTPAALEYVSFTTYVNLLGNSHFSDEVSTDEFVADFMRPDRTFESEADELKHLRSAQAVLRDELLAVYEFWDKQGL